MLWFEVNIHNSNIGWRGCMSEDLDELDDLAIEMAKKYPKGIQGVKDDYELDAFLHKTQEFAETQMRRMNVSSRFDYHTKENLAQEVMLLVVKKFEDIGKKIVATEISGTENLSQQLRFTQFLSKQCSDVAVEHTRMIMAQKRRGTQTNVGEWEEGGNLGWLSSIEDKRNDDPNSALYLKSLKGRLEEVFDPSSKDSRAKIAGRESLLKGARYVDISNEHGIPQDHVQMAVVRARQLIKKGNPELWKELQELSR